MAGTGGMLPRTIAADSQVQTWTTQTHMRVQKTSPKLYTRAHRVKLARAARAVLAFAAATASLF